MTEPTFSDDQKVYRLSDLSPQQWKSGIAAWLGWLFDGLDMHLYTMWPFLSWPSSSRSLISAIRR